jgi:hypothetical protein
MMYGPAFRFCQIKFRLGQIKIPIVKKIGSVQVSGTRHFTRLCPLRKDVVFLHSLLQEI